MPSSSKEPELPNNLTTNENNGLKEIVTFYSGQIHFAKGATPATADSPQNRFFEVTLSDSETIDKLADQASLPASNMAWLMYKNMGTEVNNYDEIHSALVFGDGKKVTTKFPVSDLKIVAKKMVLLNKIVSIIKSRRYGDLRPYINDKELFDYDKEEIIKKLIDLDDDFGTVSSFSPFGFKRNKTIDGKSILHISGHIIRAKMNNEFSIAVDMNSDKEEVLFLQYEL